MEGKSLTAQCLLIINMSLAALRIFSQHGPINIPSTSTQRDLSFLRGNLLTSFCWDIPRYTSPRAWPDSVSSLAYCWKSDNATKAVSKGFGNCSHVCLSFHMMNLRKLTEGLRTDDKVLSSYPGTEFGRYHWNEYEAAYHHECWYAVINQKNGPQHKRYQSLAYHANNHHSFGRSSFILGGPDSKFSTMWW